MITKIKTENLYSLIVIICTSIYMTSFSFSFFPITEGWFIYAGNKVIHGEHPYTDFYLFLPPLYTYITALIIKLFGINFFAFRIIGVIVNTGIAYISYKILIRFFRPSTSTWASLVSIVYYVKGNAFISYDFIHFMILFLYLSLYLLILATEHLDKKTQINAGPYFYFSGFMLSLACLIKHSNASLVGVSLGSAVLLISFIYKEKKGLLLFIAGVLTPVLIMFLHLLSYGGVSAFYQQTVMDAYNVKGKGGKIFSAWFSAFNEPYFTFSKRIFLLILSLGYFWFPFLLDFLSKERLNFPKTITKLLNFKFQSWPLLLIIPSFFGLIIYSIANKLIPESIINEGDHFNNYIFVIVSIFTAIGLTYHTIKALKYKEKKSIIYLLAIFFEIGMIFGAGTSAGIGEVGLIFGFAFIIAYFIEQRSFLKSGSLTCVIITFFLLSFYISKRYEKLYSWWYTDAGSYWVSRESYRGIPSLRNIQLIKSDYDNILEITNTIKDSHAKSIFCFPHIPLFYLLTEATSPLKAIVHWFDFYPDRLIEEDLKLLKKSPPQFILLAELPELAWKTHELLFRGGQELAHRKLLSYIKTSKNYKFIAEKKINELTVAVYKIKKQ